MKYEKSRRRDKLSQIRRVFQFNQLAEELHCLNGNSFHQGMNTEMRGKNEK
jgi:hypothetical protein